MEKQITINDTTYDIPKGVTSLSKDGIYSVDLNLIDYATKIDNENEEFQWFNFRHLSSKGLDDESMTALRESIQSDGLMHPIICRWYINENNELRLQMIEGERRCRSIRTLVESNVECWSKIKNKMLPAKEVYKTIPCRIIVGDDKECLRVAFTILDNSIDWGGESVKTRIVMKLRQANCTDEEILKITKKSSAWLRDETILCGLDDKTFSFYETEKINRSVALRLSKMDIEERHKVLEDAYEKAEEEYQEELSEVENEVNKAVDAEEVAEANLELMKESEDEESIEEATKEFEKAKEKLEKKKEKKEKIKQKKPKVKTKHLKDNDEVKEIDFKEMIKSHQERLEEINANKGIIDKDNIIPSEVLPWLVAVYKGIMSEQEDLNVILKRQIAMEKLLNCSSETNMILSKEEIKEMNVSEESYEDESENNEEEFYEDKEVLV